MDRDGDGVTDAAPDGQCCAIMHMMGDFSSCSSWTGSTDLASMAGCCPSDWLLRWSLVGSAGAATEDRSMVDCVKFVASADCVPPAGWIGAATFKAAGCPHALPTPPPTTATPPPSPNLGDRDRDGDGVEDAAADGACCMSCRTCAFGPGDFGQDLATCRAQTDACWCADDYLVRYAIREDAGYWREDRSTYDCVSFVSEPVCSARMGMWMSEGCPHALPTPSPTQSPMLSQTVEAGGRVLPLLVQWAMIASHVTAGLIS